MTTVVNFLFAVTTAFTLSAAFFVLLQRAHRRYSASPHGPAGSTGRCDSDLARIRHDLMAYPSEAAHLRSVDR